MEYEVFCSVLLSIMDRPVRKPAFPAINKNILEHIIYIYIYVAVVVSILLSVSDIIVPMTTVKQ